eukprot:g27107.t1
MLATGYGQMGQQDACGLQSSAEKAIYEFTQRISQLPHLLKESDADRTDRFPAPQCSFEAKVKPALLEELSTARGSSKVSSNGSEREAPSEAPAEVDGKLDGLEETDDRRERQLGCQFGSFRLLKRLGQGSQGRVYVGRDATGDVAVKITQLNKKHLIDRFNREVEIMKLLSHKRSLECIVQLVSVHWEGQLAGLVMPLAEGDLLQVISNSERRRLRESEGRHVFRQLLDGVEHMHSHQIIHRDLKLENILINSKEERLADGKLYEVKITDFGSSSIVEPVGGKFAKGPVGTPSYMAPELLTLGSKTGAARNG